MNVDDIAGFTKQADNQGSVPAPFEGGRDRGVENKNFLPGRNNAIVVCLLCFALVSQVCRQCIPDQRSHRLYLVAVIRMVNTHTE